MLINYKDANSLFYYDSDNIKKLIENKFSNCNEVAISFYDDKILFYNLEKNNFSIRDYKIEKIDKNVILTLKNKKEIFLEDINFKKIINLYANNKINEEQIIEFIAEELKNKHIFYENLRNKLNYVINNKIDFELIFNVIKHDPDIKKILKENKEKINKLRKILLKENNLFFTSDYIFYIPDTKKEIKILLAGNAKKYLKILESKEYYKKVINILRQVKNYESLIKNKEYLTLFEKEDYKKLLENFKILKFLPKNELKSLLEKTMIKLKKKNINESIKNKIFPKLNKLIENDEETQEFKNYIKDLNKKEKEEIEKEVEKDNEQNEEEKEKNLKILNQELIKQLKTIFEKIKEYLDEETPSYEYVEKVLLFLDDIEKNTNKVNIHDLQNVLYILSGGQEIHPAIKDNYLLKRKVEKKENNEEGKEENKKENNEEENNKKE